MRRIAFGLLLAAGVTMPSLALAQDDHHQDGRPQAEQGGGGHAAVAPGSGGYRAQPGQRGYHPGQAPGSGGYRPQPGQPGYGGPPVAPGSGGYRPQPGQPGYHPGYGGPPVAPGSGGYRPQPGQPGYHPPYGGPPVAPGSGGYRPQPGQPGYHGGGYNGGGYNGGGYHGGGYNGGAYRGGGYRPAPPAPGPGGGWNRGWRGDQRFDFHAYRVQNNYIFHLSPYYAPPGWGYGYRRFAAGFTLEPFLFEQNYWIADPYYYRLPPVWGPYRWVRYYNDALLVDVRSGLVVDTVYGIFW